MVEDARMHKLSNRALSDFPEFLTCFVAKARIISDDFTIFRICCIQTGNEYGHR